MEEKNKSQPEDEYDKYLKSLVFKKECAACHYLQGTIFLGISLFTAFRTQFIYNTLTKGKILTFSGLSIATLLISFYKFSYSYHIYKNQTQYMKTFGTENNNI
jgi:hypothetical protein